MEVLNTKDKVQVVLAEKLLAQLTLNWDPYAQQSKKMWIT